MEWLYYLLEANLYLVLFYGFYKLLLYKETFYSINRFYLIFSPLAAFLLPFLQLGILKYPKIIVANFPSAEVINRVDFQIAQVQNPTKEIFFTGDNILLTIYILVALVFLSKLFISLARILKMQTGPSTIVERDVKLYELKGSKVAFSFFNLLFLDPDLQEKETILKHELVHIKQRHSFDVLFFEMLQIINWFNPICYIIKHDVKLIHEYLADEKITHFDVEKYSYAMFLIKNSIGIQDLRLTNQIFNSSKLKNRINMLNQKKSTSWARLKLVLVLPLVAAMLVTSTLAFKKPGAILDLYPKKEEIHQISKKPDSIKSPPQTYFYSKNEFNGQTGNIIKVDSRYIVINGKGVEDNKLFFGVQNTESVKYLTQAEAVSKYGQKARNGAVEVTGGNIKMFDKAPILPPFPKLSLNRGHNEVLRIPDSDFELKTLTVYNSKGKVVYNTTDYRDDWNGKKGNYGKYNSALPVGKYQYLMKIAGEPFKNKRGIINITDKMPTPVIIQK